ncbi:Protein patched -like protein 1 [Echinococcus granulosus]|nr:Protein patched -like protein 1 [Echinococcus granulosus]
MSGQKEDIEFGLTKHSGKHHVPVSCCSSLQLWWYYKFTALEKLLHTHHWKVFSVLLPLVLLCLGLKFAKPEADFYRLWVVESGRLSAELNYLAKALRSADMHHQIPPYAGSIYHQPPSWGDLYLRSPDLIPAALHASPLGGLPGSEFMGSIESILQTSTSASPTGNLLTLEALRDHMDLLVKIHKLEVKVGASKWRLEDLCQRAELPSVAGLHSIESFLAQLIPCIVITPADCFWEGSKVIAPDTVVQIPWPNKQYTLQWSSLNPHHMLSSLRSEYGNHSSEMNYLDELTDMLNRTGLSHGYLTRPCLDPHDPGCPSLSPNYKAQSPDIACVVTNGCPSFAANILHWPRDLLLGGQRCFVRNHSTASCGNPGHRLVHASALQSLLLLRSPQDLYRTVRFNDPYKHESWTLLDAQNTLDQWRSGLKHLLIVHNKAISGSRSWQYYGFTDNSLRDLLTQSTVSVWFAQLAGAVVLVLLYGMVCLLCWREPSRSQCWLALAGLGLIVLALVAGLGICSLIGLPFNVLSIQVLPFLILGFGMEGLFVFTTCNTCVLSRSAEVNQKAVLWTTHVLAEHGTAFVFSALVMAAAFFAAIYLPVPVMRQFCLQAGILVLVQAVTIMALFPVLLKLDSRRRVCHRMDVLCCLRQPVSMAHHDTEAASATITASASPSYLVTPSDPSEGIVRVVETTSTKVRLSGNAVATVKVSVSTRKPPILVKDIHSCGHGSLGVVFLECLCSSCQHRQSCTGGPLFIRLANRLAAALSQFLSLRIVICLLGLSLVASAAVLAPLRLRLGLNLLSLIPTDAIEHGFVEKSSETFGLIHFQLITRGSDAILVAEPSPPAPAEGFIRRKPEVPQVSALSGPGVDFARSQTHLRTLFSEVASLPGVSFTGKRIWLDSMHDWLLGLQRAFDADVQNGYISPEGNWTEKASEEGVLGLLLIVQTDNGIDLGRIRTGRLVHNRVIEPSAFRVYLHAWRVLDVFNYTSPPCTIIPDPGLHLGRITLPQRVGGPSDLYSISPADPIQLTQTAFFARGYGDIADQIRFVKRVRALTEQSISQGVPVFPTGLPFTLAEQYLTFWQHFVVTSGILVGAVLVAGLIFLPRPVAALLAVCVGGGGAVSACLLGFLVLGLDLNAISGGLVLIAFGLGTKLSSGVLCGWYGPQHNIHHRSRINASSFEVCNDSGSKEAAEREVEVGGVTATPPAPLRVKKLFAILRNQISQIVHANVSLVLAVALLAAVRVEFIADHFFRLVGIISLACLFDCLVLLPTVCFVLEPIFPSPLYTMSSPPPVHIRHDVETTISDLLPHSPTPSPLPTSPPSTLPSRVESTDFSPFINAQATEEDEEEDEEDLAMRQLCDSLKRSTILEFAHRDRAAPSPPPSAVIDLFTNALRDASRHASLSTISEEPSNSSSTISLHPPPPLITPSHPPPPPPPSSHHHHLRHHPAAVRMKMFLPLLNAAMVAAQRHHQHQQQQQARRGGGTGGPEPPPPPYTERLPSASS